MCEVVSATFHELVCLFRELDPVGFALADHYPLFHQSSVTGIEAAALAGLDQLVDLRLGEFDYELASREHGENLVVDPEAVGGHHLAASNAGTISEGLSDGHKPGIHFGSFS